MIQLKTREKTLNPYKCAGFILGDFAYRPQEKSGSYNPKIWQILRE